MFHTYSIITYYVRKKSIVKIFVHIVSKLSNSSNDDSIIRSCVGSYIGTYKKYDSIRR